MFKTDSEFIKWINHRLPIVSVWKKFFTEYYAPINLNFWYYFGSLALFVLVNQIITGVWLTMYYTPTANEAFDSIEHTIRQVNFGWLLRYMHTTGASAFFVVIYLHIYRCLLYGSYKSPRELLWIIGVFLYILLMTEAFTGYVLPWGQMSYWASRVITSIIMAIPLVGETIGKWFMGDYTVSGVTLHRFFSYHVAAVPMAMIIFVIIHLSALRKVGSNNPDGIEIKEKLDENDKPLDGIAFHPYYTVKDLLALVFFLLLFTTVIFYFPSMGGYFLEPDNFIPANILKTPEHIAPAWYLAPYYAILRAVPNKLLGIITLLVSVLVLFLLPWLDRSKVKSIRYKGNYSKIALAAFTVSFIGLAYIGTTPVSTISNWLGRLFTILYFLFFFLMPFYTTYEKTKKVPDRVPMHEK